MLTVYSTHIWSAGTRSRFGSAATRRGQNETKRWGRQVAPIHSASELARSILRSSAVGVHVFDLHAHAIHSLEHKVLRQCRSRIDIQFDWGELTTDF